MEVDLGGAGAYDRRVVQRFDPEAAESEEVFLQNTPHFVVEIRPPHDPSLKTVPPIPGFPEGAAPGT